MSTPLHQPTPPEVTEHAACMCQHGDVCSSFAAGHALHLIQERLAAATPSEWTDALVDTTDAGSGIIVLRGLDGTEHRVWSAAGAALEVEPGLPVALHPRYRVFAVGRTRYNVGVIDAGA